MARTKEKIKILHEPTTHEIFQCLSGMPVYSEILLNNYPDKPYANFLQWLIKMNFYINTQEKISIKRLATDFKTDTSKATKWIKEVYEDIFELNFDRPKVFQKDEIKLSLYIRSYDSHCIFFTSLHIIPRELETVKFPFVHGKVGTDIFWVKKVEHLIEENTVKITLWLEGGFRNKYREFALDKALFQGEIGHGDVFQKHSFELDEKIKKIYRN